MHCQINLYLFVIATAIRQSTLCSTKNFSIYLIKGGHSDLKLFVSLLKGVAGGTLKAFITTAADILILVLSFLLFFVLFKENKAWHFIY